MRIKRRKTIPYLFGPKHIDYLRACETNVYNVAEGAIRSGKTVDHIYSFAKALKTSLDRIHLASGATVASAKMVIGDSNGFGLEWIFRGQCKWGKYKDNEALIIRGPDTAHKTKIVIFAGAAKADSFKKIRGNSYGMWIATEINLHHDSFVKEAQNRLVAAANLKVYWDLNPDHPKAKIYTDYIDKWRADLEFPGGFNYQHFTLDDNITISEDRKDAIKRRYDPSSIWYLRDILGMRTAAEGLIYKQFTEIVYGENNRCKVPVEKLPGRFMMILVGVDFGGRESKHSFNAVGITDGFQRVYGLRSRRIIPSTPKALENDFVAFCKAVEEDFGQITEVRVDSAEQVLKQGLITAVHEARLFLAIKDALKIKVADRIALVSTLIAQGRFFYTEDAQALEEALCEAVWDEKEINLVRLDDGTSDIDTLDSFEYTIERYAKTLVQLRGFDESENQETN